MVGCRKAILHVPVLPPPLGHNSHLRTIYSNRWKETLLSRTGRCTGFPLLFTCKHVTFSVQGGSARCNLNLFRATPPPPPMRVGFTTSDEPLLPLPDPHWPCSGFLPGFLGYHYYPGDKFRPYFTLLHLTNPRDDGTEGLYPVVRLQILALFFC